MGTSERPQRLRVLIRGAVQGVGFRPFVYRLARELDLAGWVTNSGQGVSLEVEGEPAALRAFLLRLEAEKPPRASIQSLEPAFLDPAGLPPFAIRASQAGGSLTAHVLPDIATCPDCLAEILDPADRRFGYPFTNCTNCGPRYSIIQALPYDRSRTSMAGFSMCSACRTEYVDPADRRFHAQPNACPACGPRLAWWDPSGRSLAQRAEALAAAAEAIRQGRIVAVKGLGGFHLMVDARSEVGVGRLRARKHREEKPFALLYPNLAALEQDCRVDDLERRLLASPEAPIVLLRRRETAGIAPAVAPGNPCLGAMLPSNPLHHLLLRGLGFPLVATSGNRADEPLCTDEAEALVRLGGIADMFLVHDRPILRHVDDSIARVLLGGEQLLRRARGYAPLPVPLRWDAPPLLAVGAHLKNSLAVSVGPAAFLSQHLGDLETREAAEAFERTAESLQALYRVVPEAVACDAHPDYRSTRYAEAIGLPLVRVQHHAAHVLACMAENQLDPPLLGVAWDGTGYGEDGTVWGGEFLLVTAAGVTRAAHLRPFSLPGGEQAVREPRRAALGLLYELFGEAGLDREELAPVRSFPPADRGLLRRMLARDLNCPRTTSAGRLFDGVAALLGLRPVSTFEGQAAMELEWCCDPAERGDYPCPLLPGEIGPARLDWGPLVGGLLADLAAGQPVPVLAARFHNSLARALVAVAEMAGQPRVILTGGCFQNRVLTEAAVAGLRAAGFAPAWHQRVPPNDGGIALGQLVAACRQKES